MRRLVVARSGNHFRLVAYRLKDNLNDLVFLIVACCRSLTRGATDNDRIMSSVNKMLG